MTFLCINAKLYYKQYSFIVCNKKENKKRKEILKLYSFNNNRMEFNSIRIETDKNIGNDFLDTQHITSLSDYNSKRGLCVSGAVVKYINESGLVIDLNNGIKGLISIDDFEDTEKISNIALINKVGQVVFGEIKGITDTYVLLSRKNLQSAYKKNFLNTLTPGTVFDTTVLSLAPFGAFVDIGYGIPALLPIGDIMIARFSNIKEVIKVGMHLKVVYKGIVNNGYVVSHKELLGTWEENISNFKSGEFCQGIIRETKPYGAFIEIAPNLTGLADYPSDFNIHVGDSVCVLFKSYNPEKLKVKLSIVRISDVSYHVNYDYFVKEGILTDWVYTPKDSMKKIETKFDGNIDLS